MSDALGTLVRIAVRNLRRNRWRTGLTAGGIALAVGMLIWTNAYIDTFVRDMVRAATAVEIGQVQINTDAWFERNSLYRSFAVDDAYLERVRGVEGVRAAAPRVYAHGLVGNEERSQVARLVGVDPLPESRASLLAEGIAQGRWLAAEPAELPGPRECVLGYQLAEQLRVAPGDELVVFLQAADGSLGNDLLVVVGTLRTNNAGIDRSTVLMHEDDLKYAAVLEGRAHEIVVSVDRLDEVDLVAESLREALPPAEGAPTVRTWKQTMSDLYEMLDTSSSSMWVTYLLIYAIAGMGLLNTQRMSALERRREFGVLIGLGMRHRRIGGMIVIETVLLTAIGAVGGLVLGGGLALLHKFRGLDMMALTDRSESFSFMGIAFSERMYFEVSAGTLIEPCLVVQLVALLCGLVPAWGAFRIDAVRAIAGRT